MAMSAQDLWDTFEWSYDQQKDDLDRMSGLQDTYDNVIDKKKWPTISKIPLAVAWATVEEALGPAMEYLFPPQPFINLLSEEDLDDDLVHRTEWALHLMMVMRMRLQRECLRSVKDCMKIGVGYGIIEPITVTPPAVFEIQAGNNRARQMGPGLPTTSLRFRYLSAGKVLPYPSGVDFNGNDATPIAYLTDLYPEAQFRSLFANQDTADPAFKGDADNIIEEARQRGFAAHSGVADLVDKLAGRKTGARGQRSAKSGVPCMVPVLKCFLEDRHVWMFPGSEKQIIFDRSSTYATMRKPLIKFDAWMDADRWYPMSMPEANQRNCWAKNVWFNLFFDLATWAAKRPLVYDSTEQDGPPEFGPRGAIGLPGDVNKTARFLDPPGIDQGSLEISREIDANRREITGQKDFTERNFTRGGTLAFQDLVASSTGRDRLRHSILQLGAMEPIANQTMIYMQTLASEMNLRFKRPARRTSGSDRGRKYTEIYEVTEDDLKHAFVAVLDLDSKHRKGSMDIQNKFAAYDRKVQSPYFDQYEVARDLCMDEIEAQAQVLPAEEVRAKQAQKEAVELAATLGDVGAGGVPAAGETAAAGAALGGAA